MNSPSDGAAAELRELVVEVLERIERDGVGALEQACAQHPELAERLRARVDSLRGLGLVRDGAAANLPERIDDFRIVERIGAGGMGVVYRAEQISLGREVALKVIRPEILGMERARERFARETAVVARLQHPGVVPIYTVGPSKEQPYYAMEWVRGCTLAQALTRLEGRVPRELKGADLVRAVVAASPHADRDEQSGAAWLFDGSWEETCLRIARGIAEALEHAHRRGVLHRDVKPGNVMITPGGRVMLVDFGLSHSEGDVSVTGTGERLGSLHFMPPELVRGGPSMLDARSDIYSLGATLYQLLTLELPFEAASEPAVMQRILEGRPVRPREHLPTLSWEAETVCLAAIDRDPERRYPTAAAFARDLANALERRSVDARRASRWLRLRRWVERRPGEAAALALGALLLVGVPSLIAAYEQRETRLARAAMFELTAEKELVATERDHARQQEARAERNYAVALGTVDSLLRSVAEERLDQLPGMIELRDELAAEAAQAYVELSREQPDHPELIHLGASTMRLRAWVMQARGQQDQAQDVLRESLVLLGSSREADDWSLRIDRALNLDALASMGWDPVLQDRALVELRALVAERPKDAVLVSYLCQALSRSVLIDRSHGLEQTRETLDEAVAVARQLVELDAHQGSLRLLADALVSRAGLTWADARLDDARSDYEEALEWARQARDSEPLEVETRQVFVNAGISLSGLLGQLEGGEDVLLLMAEVEPDLEWMLANYPDTVAHMLMAASFHLSRGILQAKLGRLDDSSESFEACVTQSEAAEQLVPESSVPQFTMAKAWICQAGTLMTQGDYDLGLEVCEVALEHLQEAVRRSPDNSDVRSWLAVERLQRGRLLYRQGHLARAAECLAEVPALAEHRTDRIQQGIGIMGNCLDQSALGAQGDVIAACLAAAQRMLELCDQRADLQTDPSVARLRARLQQ